MKVFLFLFFLVLLACPLFIRSQTVSPRSPSGPTLCCDVPELNRLADGGFEGAPPVGEGGAQEWFNGQVMGGWSVTGGSVTLHNKGYRNLGAGNLFLGGDQHLDLNGQTFGRISQTADSLIPGIECMILFRYAVHDLAPRASARLRIDDGLVLDTFWSATNPGNVSWQEARFTFVPDKTVITIDFSGSGDMPCCGMLLDNIRVFQCPDNLVPVETALKDTICDGDAYVFADRFLLESGTYHDTLTAENGCDSIVHLLFTVKDTAQVEKMVLLCPGETFEGLAFTSDTTLVRILPLSNGCDSTTMIHIDVDDPQIRISGKTGICSGQITTLTVNTFPAYQWSTGDSSPSIQVDKEGTYTVTVTTERGCLASASIQVDQFLPQAQIKSGAPRCAGEKTGTIRMFDVQGGKPPYRFSLDGETFQRSDTFSGLAPGAFEVLLLDTLGCSFRDKVVIPPAQPFRVLAGPDTTLRPGDSLVLRLTSNMPVSSVRWSPSTGLSCTDCLDPLLRPTRTARYTAAAANADGCTATGAVQIRVDAKAGVYIPNAFSPNGDGQNDRFEIMAGPKVDRISRLLIFDRWGNLVFEQTEYLSNSPGSGWDGTYQGRPVDTGAFAYFAEVWFKDGKTERYQGTVLLVR